MEMNVGLLSPWVTYKRKLDVVHMPPKVALGSFVMWLVLRGGGHLGG